MSQARKLILSIDGGGMRGLVAVRILQALESRLRQRSIHEPVCRLFDLVCGTSTGGITAAGLTAPHADGTPGKPAMSLADLRGFYEDEGRDIFHRSLPLRVRRMIVSGTGLFDETYDVRPLEKRLQARLGWASLQSALTGVLLTAYDIENRRPVLMSNKEALGGDAGDDYLFWQAARATSAVPTLFEPALVDNLTLRTQQSLIDGGLVAHDPALVAYVEGLKLGWRPEEILLLSIGTGTAEEQKISHEDASGWGGLGWINPANGSPILSILLDSQAAMSASQAEHLLNRDGETRYIRINGKLPAGSGRIDDARPGNIRRLNEAADRFIRDNAVSLDFVAEAISDTRMARAC